MTDFRTPPSSSRTHPLRFSMGTLLLLVMVACLATALLLNYRKSVRLEQELRSLRPMSAHEVARQFEESTTLGPISTTVTDVRYSTTDDAYKVDFSWVDATTGKTWYTDVKLTADGYGVYYGSIRNGPFINPLGVKDGFTVAVETPPP